MFWPKDKKKNKKMTTCKFNARIHKVLSEVGGPTLTFFFLVDEGREDPNTTISEPSLDSQENTI